MFRRILEIIFKVSQVYLGNDAPCYHKMFIGICPGTHRAQQKRPGLAGHLPVTSGHPSPTHSFLSSGRRWVKAGWDYWAAANSGPPAAGPRVAGSGKIMNKTWSDTLSAGPCNFPANIIMFSSTWRCLLCSPPTSWEVFAGQSKLEHHLWEGRVFNMSS